MLRNLLDEAYSEFLKQDQTKTMVHRGLFSQLYWQRCMERPPRRLHTIIASPGLKESVIDDVKDFLLPETQSWYGDCGIPWRRGYLFSGPSGTGKTSFSLALAGHFKLRIYTLSLNSRNGNEDSLASLSRPSRASGSGGQNDERGRISLSGLLNILDGTSSQEGRILIMTTNHAEHLDKALLRPGRVDMTVNFTLSDRTMSAAIFRNIFSNLCKEVKSQGAAGGACKAPRRTFSEIEDLSEAFAAKIPPGEFSPAELQGYLLHHRGKPEAAIAGAEYWARETILDRIKDEKSVVIASQSSSRDIDSEDVDSEDVDSEDVDSEDVDSEDVDSEEIAPEDIDRPKDIGRPRKDSRKQMTLEEILGR
ncbi:mitochondrial chaperone bcs1 [Colletotrichum plurivorum]|uniref:Mitochondrial chaperone bcs1 n=1 Tax=Colletotrichum plurivorum TaxID=2175906 RepID=A0A8H6NNN1_9PEZI|nr:mitochondrial chaperone bcs1 [Colletotrichum plurivorum]